MPRKLLLEHIDVPNIGAFETYRGMVDMLPLKRQ